ncbi:MAG: spore coat U domain-containing protein [Proteobacteria bacterium]|nr:spore coat U domain-containing protein [Pseudomonadota bacterium]
MKKLLTAICLVTTLLFAGTVFATDATGTLSVNATVNASCTVTGNTLAFGAYNKALGTDGQTTISVDCTIGTTNKIVLSNGGHYSNPYKQMTDSGGTYYLQYQLYTTSARDTVWPAIAPGVDGPTGNGSGQSVDIFGRIPAGQAVKADTYTDSVLITVSF